MKTFKILVCGSREIKDKEYVFKVLDYLSSKRDLKEFILIHGDQKSFDKHLEVYYGADYFANLWAEERGVKVDKFPADWDNLGRRAGPIRNSLMLKENPNACVAFLSKTAKK